MKAKRNSKVSHSGKTRGGSFAKITVPAGWEATEFSEVFEFLPTNSFSREEMSYEIKSNSYFNIHYGDIHAAFDEQILDFKKHINQIPVLIHAPQKIDEDSLLRDGDLIIADASEDYAGVGECIEIVSINGRKVLSGLHTIAARDKAGRTQKGFRAYLLNHPQVSINLKRVATGSKVYGVSKANIVGLILIIPPLPEQKKIALILSTWDRAIEKTEQLIAQKQELKTGLMQQLLTGKVRFKEFKQKPWIKRKLEQYIEIRSGDSPANYQLKSEGKIPYLKVEDLNNSSKWQRISRNYSNEERNVIPINSVIFPKRGAAILNNKVRLSATPIMMDSNLMAITVTSAVLDFEYLYYTIQKEKLSKIADTSTIPQINNKHINPYKIFFPPLEEQRRISEVLNFADTGIQFLKSHLLILRTEKRGLMQKLLTGQLRTNPKPT